MTIEHLKRGKPETETRREDDAKTFARLVEATLERHR